MMGAVQARRRGERRSCTAGRCSTPRTRSSSACVEGRVPATVVGNGAELPQFEQLVDARCVRAPAGRGLDPAARAVPLPRRARPRARGGRRGRRRRRVAAARASRSAHAGRGRGSPARGPARPRLHRVLGRAVRHRVARRARRRRDQGRSGAATRRDPLQRGGAPARRPAVLREVGAVPRRRTSASAASRSISGIPTGSRSPSSSSRRADVVVENFTPRVLEQFGLDYDTVRVPAARRRHAAPARVRPHRAVARPPRIRADDGADHRHGLGHGLRGRPADHRRRRRRSDGRHARRARARRRARAPRPHRRRPARRGAADRGRDRGDRRAGDPALGRRHAARPPRRGRRLPMRGRRTSGSRSTGRATRSRPTRVPSGARRASPKPPRTSCVRRGVPAAAVAPAFAALDDPQMQARGFFEAVEHVDVGVQQVSRRGRCGSRRVRRRGGRAPRRRWASTPTPCCATTADARMRSSNGSAPST